MMQKLQALLRLSRRPATRFDGQLLDRKREDVFVQMHCQGFIR
jgi:hypothetical protein